MVWHCTASALPSCTGIGRGDVVGPILRVTSHVRVSGASGSVPVQPSFLDPGGCLKEMGMAIFSSESGWMFGQWPGPLIRRILIPPDPRVVEVCAGVEKPD